MLFCSHVVARIDKEVLVYWNEVPWPVAKAEAEMRPQTSPCWIPGAIVHEISAGDGVLGVAETPDGSQRLLSHIRDVPAHLLTLLCQGQPIS